jgi:hypothetical protein
MEAQRVEKELCPMVEGWFGKLEHCNTIVDKRFIKMEEETDKVVALVGEKIEGKFREISSQFLEAMEEEEACLVFLEGKVWELEGKLETSHATNILLASLITSIQSRVGELEDVVMEDVEKLDAEGEIVESLDSLSSTDVDPVENMVVISVPAPSQIHSLIPIEVPLEFIPLSLRGTPSPPYFLAREDDPAHDRVLEHWVDQD